jgi:hypothetical protein
VAGPAGGSAAFNHNRPDWQPARKQMTGKAMPFAVIGGRPATRSGSSIDKNATITGQSTEKADQNASSLQLFYTLFTRKSEG